MQVNIYSEWSPEEGEIYGLSATDVKGSRFTFRQYFTDRAEADYHRLILQDYTSFVCEEKKFLIQDKLTQILG